MPAHENEGGGSGELPTELGPHGETLGTGTQDQTKGIREEMSLGSTDSTGHGVSLDGTGPSETQEKVINKLFNLIN